MRDKHHVLIVCAELRIGVSWEQALERAGYHVSYVGRGATALALLEAERIHAVIIDVSLSDMAADTLATTIRERTPDCCVLLRMAGEPAMRADVGNDARLLLLPPAVSTQRLKKCLAQLLQQPVPPIHTYTRRYAPTPLHARLS